MLKPEREARLQRMKALGRIAYGILKSSEIDGVLDYDGEKKQLRIFEEDGLYMEMVEPFRSDACPNEFSRIVIRQGRHKVFQIQWSTGDYSLFLRAGRLGADAARLASTNSILGDKEKTRLNKRIVEATPRSAVQSDRCAEPAQCHRRFVKMLEQPQHAPAATAKLN